MNPFIAVSNSLKKSWRGEEKLWKVFWLWGVLGNVVVWLCFLFSFGGSAMAAGKILIVCFLFYFLCSGILIALNRKYTWYMRIIIEILFAACVFVFVAIATFTLSFLVFGSLDGVGYSIMALVMIVAEYIK